MIYYYAEATCGHCQKKNRVLLEQAYEEEHFLVPGDALVTGEVPTEEEVVCEHCFAPYRVSVRVKDRSFYSIDGQRNHEGEGSERQNEKRPPNPWIEQEEAGGELASVYSISFEEQPFHLYEALSFEGQTWTVRESYKKEHTERDEEKRLEQPFVPAYHYLLEAPNGQRKWLEVREDEGENARLSENLPFAMAHEHLFRIDETAFKSECLFKEAMGSHYIMEAYRHVSGVQVKVLRNDEEEEELTVLLDLFGDDVEALMQQAQEWLHVTE